MTEIDIRDIKGFQIGQAEDRDAATGCTVVICENGAAAGLDVRGGGPASRESQLLDPLANAEYIHAVLLAGGSAFGLDAAGGVQRFLEERGIGYDVGVAKVPLVCQADLFDLTVGRADVRPDAAMAYRACEGAYAKGADGKPGNYKDGCRGAGTGATVGKICGMERCTKTGMGSYAVRVGELEVGALVALNALGDVFDWKRGRQIAGLVSEDRKGFADSSRQLVRITAPRDNKFAEGSPKDNSFISNTTLAVILTNADLSKARLCKVAGMAQDGMARAVRPVHTSADGDSVFALAAGAVKADTDLVGCLAADVLAEAIKRAVLAAESSYGIRSAAGIRCTERSTIMKDHHGIETFKLGFGLMRLPKLEDGSIDVEQVKTMADMFIEAGGTYFDTAYVYDNGASEEAFRKAVAERYPRESYTVATKLNAWHGASDEAGAKQEFFTSLERLGTGYIDFYLLHALMADSYHLYDDWGLWDFVKEQRDKGLIKHWGFSFHATPEILEELLTAHPDVDFIQLQLNYADWESESVYSRRCWEIACKHGKPIVVMEPIKGGKLADPPKEVAELLKNADPNASFASWALRYAASLKNVFVVLSGMSNTAQMEQNLSFMKDFRPLDEKEQKVLKEARRIIDEDLSIQCTACHYCTEGCPMLIPIPEIFKVANANTLAHRNPRAWKAYADATEGKGKASYCVSCGHCEAVCPQHLPVISLLQSCRDLEK